MPRKPSPIRHLVVVFGDQLNADAVAFDGFDPKRDAVWMAEVATESTHVWSHKQRIVLFLSAMRHFRDDLRKSGQTVYYTELGDADNQGTLSAQLTAFLKSHTVEKVVCVEPGEHRVRAGLEAVCQAAKVPLEVREDAHFMSSIADFAAHAEGRKELRMEYFYRGMRKRHRVLMDATGKPEGGDWNFDKENRKSFGKEGPQLSHPPKRFRPDKLTRAVLKEVEERFPDHPGSLDSFAWPVRRAQALAWAASISVRPCCRLV